jgi:hypothetical protein
MRSLYSALCAHRSISRALKTGKGCESCRVWAFLRYQPKGLEEASSYDLACFRKASTFSWLAREGQPPASFISTDTTILGSCATRRAARSHVSSAARNHLISCSSRFRAIMTPKPNPYTRTPTSTMSQPMHTTFTKVSRKHKICIPYTRPQSYSNFGWNFQLRKLDYVWDMNTNDCWIMADNMMLLLSAQTQSQNSETEIRKLLRGRWTTGMGQLTSAKCLGALLYKRKKANVTRRTREWVCSKCKNVGKCKPDAMITLEVSQFMGKDCLHIYKLALLHRVVQVSHPQNVCSAISSGIGNSHVCCSLCACAKVICIQWQRCNST